MDPNPHPTPKQGRKSMDLAINIIYIIYSFSNFSQFHQLLQQVHPA